MKWKMENFRGKVICVVYIYVREFEKKKNDKALKFIEYE